MAHELPFPRSLPEFQKLFPDDSQSATYAEHYSGDWEHPSFAVGM